MSQTASSKLRFAAIGCDRMAWKDLSTIGMQRNVEVVALCDIDRTQFARAEKAWPGLPKYSDYRKMLDQLGDEIDAVELHEGLNIIANGDVNDVRDERVEMARRLLTLHTLDSPVKFLAVASKVFARPPSPPGRPSIVLRGKDRGTVSSTLISLGKKPRDAIYQFSNGAPDQTKYEDCSPMLRDILSRGLREARTKAKVNA